VRPLRVESVDGDDRVSQIESGRVRMSTSGANWGISLLFYADLDLAQYQRVVVSAAASRWVWLPSVSVAPRTALLSTMIASDSVASGSVSRTATFTCGDFTRGDRPCVPRVQRRERAARHRVRQIRGTVQSWHGRTESSASGLGDGRMHHQRSSGAEVCESIDQG
jgi:hypothetical protein